MRFARPQRLWRKLGASAPPLLIRVAKPAVAAFGLAALLFVAYEIVERTWLRDVEMVQLHVYHRVRGLITALVAAVLGAWLVLRAAPPLFTGEEASRQEGASGPHSTAAEREAHYAHWFILMRWIAVIVASVLVFVAVRVVNYLPEEVWRPLMMTIAALALLNVVYMAVLRARHAGGALLMIQVGGDLLVLTLLLHFSGGVENPLSAVMLFHVIIAGIVLTRRQCYLVASTASALFALLVWAEWSGSIEHYTLAIFPHYAHDGEVVHASHDAAYAMSRAALQTAIMFLTAYFATTMSERLRRGERQIELFAERALAQSQLLERALETTGTALCVCDRQLRPTWSNGRWQALFARGDAAICCAALPDGDAQARRTFEDGKTRVMEIALTDGNGSGARRRSEPRTFLLTTAPLVGTDGQITHVVELAREITEQKRIQDRVVRTEKLAAIGEIAGKVAHEVNNPIAIISAKTRLLLSDHRSELSERTAQDLVKITELSDRVARIAQGLLSYCRPSPRPVAPLDIRIPLRKAMAIVEPTASVAGVEVEQRFPSELPLVQTNGGEMEQVFLNLFVNALDAMPHGGRLSISARVDESGGEGDHSLTVEISDTGCGIPEEIRERVFEPFLTTKPEGKGTGLGLSICLGLVRSNRGTIELESEPGRGTRVLLRLPIAKAAATGAAVHA